MPVGSTSQTARQGASLPTAGGAGWEHSQKCNAVHKRSGASSDFLCKDALSLQKCRCVNTPLLTNT